MLNFRRNKINKLNIIPKNEFDEKFGFILILGLVSKENYLKTKRSFHFLNSLKDK
jgi:hypothetical protein